MSLILDYAPPRKIDLPSHEQALRAMHAWLTARYDGGAVSPAIYHVIRTLEVELAWRAHRGRP